MLLFNFLYTLYRNLNYFLNNFFNRNFNYFLYRDLNYFLNILINDFFDRNFNIFINNFCNIFYNIPINYLRYFSIHNFLNNILNRNLYNILNLFFFFQLNRNLFLWLLLFLFYKLLNFLNCCNSFCFRFFLNFFKYFPFRFSSFSFFYLLPYENIIIIITFLLLLGNFLNNSSGRFSFSSYWSCGINSFISCKRFYYAFV